MLEGVEAQIGLAGGFRVAVDGDYAAFFAKFGVLLGVVAVRSAAKCRSFDSLRSLRMTRI